MIYILFNDKELGCPMDITDEIFRTFYEEEKIIDDDVKWKLLGDAYRTDHLKIINKTITDYDITLIGKVDENNYFAFMVVYRYKNKELIRYDKTIHSPNFIDKCSKQQLLEPHKHKFKKGCKKDFEAKIISNIEIDRNDVNRAFSQFLDECHIRLEGNYIPIIIPSLTNKQTKIFQYQNPIFNHTNKGRKK